MTRWHSNNYTATVFLYHTPLHKDSRATKANTSTVFTSTITAIFCNRFTSLNDNIVINLIIYWEFWTIMRLCTAWINTDIPIVVMVIMERCGTAHGVINAFY